VNTDPGVLCAFQRNTMSSVENKQSAPTNLANWPIFTRPVGRREMSVDTSH
jgi:hypothetical protein